jgi:hypothetical protein
MAGGTTHSMDSQPRTPAERILDTPIVQNVTASLACIPVLFSDPLPIISTTDSSSETTAQIARSLTSATTHQPRAVMNASRSTSGYNNQVMQKDSRIGPSSRVYGRETSRVRRIHLRTQIEL